MGLRTKNQYIITTGQSCGIYPGCPFPLFCPILKGKEMETDEKERSPDEMIIEMEQEIENLIHKSITQFLASRILIDIAILLILLNIFIGSSYIFLVANLFFGIYFLFFVIAIKRRYKIQSMYDKIREIEEREQQNTSSVKHEDIVKAIVCVRMWAKEKGYREELRDDEIVMLAKKMGRTGAMPEYWVEQIELHFHRKTQKAAKK